MGFFNKYFGATITQSGGSFLYSKGILHLEEGYTIGQSRYMVSLGEYEISDIYADGWNNQVLTIDAESPVARLKYNNLAYSKRLKNSFHYYSDLRSQEEIENEFAATGQENFTAGTSGARLNIVAGSNLSSDILFNGRNDIGDFVFKTKIRATGWNNVFTGFYVQFGALLAGPSTSSSIRYEMRLLALTGTSHQLDLVVRSGAGGTLLRSFAVPLSNNTDYYLIASRNDSVINGLISTDGVNYTLGISLADSMLKDGSFGIGAYAFNGASINISYLEFDEVGTYLDTERYNRKVLGYGGVNEVTTARQAYGFNSSDYAISDAGASVVFGSSENFYFINGTSTSGGSFYHLRYNTQNFSDFVATMEMYGPSVSAGWMVGSATKYYTQIFRDGVNRSILRGNVPSAGVTFQNNIFFNYRAEQWNRHTLVKSGYHLRYYVNGLLANAVYGTSLTDKDDVSVGFVMNRELMAGATVEFRNFEISELDQLIDDTTIDANQTLSANFERFNADTQRTYGNYVTRLFFAGNSTGTLNIDDRSNFIIEDPKNISNVLSEKQYTLQGTDISGKAVSTRRKDISYQIDSFRSEFIDDSTMVNKDDISDILISRFVQGAVTDNVVTLTTMPILEAEVFDRVVFNSRQYGASGSYFVLNNSRYYRAAQGEYRQILTLGEY